MDKRKIAYTIACVIIILLLLGLIGVTFFQGTITALRDSNAFCSNTRDKCTPAPGYTEGAWKDHMSHHPDIYKECLA